MILGLDTATPITTVAVLGEGFELEFHDDGERPRHAQTLQPLIDEVLKHAGIELRELQKLCVGVGPGGFTGLRLGISTARAIAQGAGIPLAGVSSLEALAAGATALLEAGEWPPGPFPQRPEPAGRVVACIDARRGEVFAARFTEPRFGPAAYKPEELQLPPGTTAVGDGAVRFRAELERAGVHIPDDGSSAHRVSALMVCRLGWDREPVDRDALLPDYRREPDAVPPPLP